MQMRRLTLLLFCMLPMAALMYGCGSSSKEGSSALSDVATVPESQCIGCHSGQYRAEVLTGDIIVDKYVASKHNQNMVGCQDCHGGGAQHNGVGPLPYAKPGSAQCASCHTTTTPAFVAGNHGPTNFTLEFAEDEAHRKCSRCHSHEGALIGNMTGFTGDADTLTANADKAPGLDPDGSKTTGMKCVTCHTTHKTDELRTPNTVAAGAVVPWQPSKTVGAADPSTNKQFNLCTSCHTYTKPDGTLVASGNNGTAKFYHYTAWYRVIPTTHYDNPATLDTTTAGQVAIEGYVLRTNTANPCFDCHGHEAMTNTRQNTTPVRPSTIYTDWAQSGHAGGLLTAKYAAAKNADGTWKSNTAATVDTVMAAGSTGADYAWGHYPWQQASRQACQKCHTATGAANYMSAPATYNAANNNFSHLKLDAAGRGQQELLYCWSCHSNAGKGTLRTPGAITTEYTYNGATVTLPNAGKSNVCLVCHSGRGNMDSPAVTRNGSAYHHGVAGGTLFSSVTHTGFEFAGQDYTNKAYFAHNTIGMSDGTGPCASCHMGGKSHSFKAVDATAQTIKNQALCNTCHTSEQGLMTYAKVEEESAGYQNAGLYLTNLITNTVVN
ncbi:MAG: cytochrome c3 family protein, partial [Geobacter sp.]|nr:cytochrome c3 family protein [Geobacter sp.]